MQQTRCINCMKEIDQNARTCPHCGYDQQAEQLSYALRPNTILHGRYLVGRVIGKGGFGITYVGFDLMLEVKVAIKEYYPSGIASRYNSWSNQVVWESQSDGYQSQGQNYGSGRNRDYGSAQNHGYGSGQNQGYGSGQNQGYGSGQNQNYGSGNQGYGNSQDARVRRQESMDRVLKEARRTAKLSGVSTVVRVNEVFQENETAYIIMDFIEGITLKDYLIQNGAMTWEDCQRLLFPVMDALARAHDIGIVHRDISPDNIMIEPDGTVRLLDLGAAVDINANHGLASTGVVKSNFSPLEQYDENGKIGSWTDVYAFAATLYYCLTGKLMTPVLDRIRNPEITFPNGRSIPEEVKAALRRALAIYEDGRTQDMKTFKQELMSSDSAFETDRKRKEQEEKARQEEEVRKIREREEEEARRYAEEQRKKREQEREEKARQEEEVRKIREREEEEARRYAKEQRIKREQEQAVAEMLRQEKARREREEWERNKASQEEYEREKALQEEQKAEAALRADVETWQTDTKRSLKIFSWVYWITAVIISPLYSYNGGYGSRVFLLYAVPFFLWLIFVKAAYSCVRKAMKNVERKRLKRGRFIWKVSFTLITIWYVCWTIIFVGMEYFDNL